MKLRWMASRASRRRFSKRAFALARVERGFSQLQRGRGIGRSGTADDTMRQYSTYVLTPQGSRNGSDGADKGIGDYPLSTLNIYRGGGLAARPGSCLRIALAEA